MSSSSVAPVTMRRRKDSAQEHSTMQNVPRSKAPLEGSGFLPTLHSRRIPDRLSSVSPRSRPCLQDQGQEMSLIEEGQPQEWQSLDSRGAEEKHTSQYLICSLRHGGFWRAYFMDVTDSPASDREFFERLRKFCNERRSLWFRLWFKIMAVHLAEFEKVPEQEIVAITGTYQKMPPKSSLRTEDRYEYLEEHSLTVCSYPLEVLVRRPRRSPKGSNFYPFLPKKVEDCIVHGHCYGIVLKEEPNKFRIGCVCTLVATLIVTLASLLVKNEALARLGPMGTFVVGLMFNFL